MRETLKAFIEQKRKELQELTKKIARIRRYTDLINNIVPVYYGRVYFVDAKGLLDFNLQWILISWLIDYEDDLKCYGLKNIFPFQFVCEVIAIEERGTKLENKHGEVIIFWVGWKEPFTIDEVKESLYNYEYTHQANIGFYPIWFTVDKVLDMLNELKILPTKDKTIRHFFSKYNKFLRAENKKLFLCVDLDNINGKYHFNYTLYAKNIRN